MTTLFNHSNWPFIDPHPLPHPYIVPRRALARDKAQPLEPTGRLASRRLVEERPAADAREATSGGVREAGCPQRARQFAGKRRLAHQADRIRTGAARGRAACQGRRLRNPARPGKEQDVDEQQQEEQCAQDGRLAGRVLLQEADLMFFRAGKTKARPVDGAGRVLDPAGFGY